MKKIQSICSAEAELMSTRRRRGHAIKDAVVVLRSFNEKIADYNTSHPIHGSLGCTLQNYIKSGIGGIAHYVETDIKSKASYHGIANGWVVNGNKVKTPFGDGIVKEIIEGTLVKDLLGDGKLAEKSIRMNINESLVNKCRNTGSQSYSLRIIPPLELL